MNLHVVDRNPYFGDVRFSHLRKAGQVDISVGGSGYFDEGYRDENYQRYGRFNAGSGIIRPMPGGFLWVPVEHTVPGPVDFLIWQDADSGAFLQNPAAVSPMEGTRFNIDPYILYFDRQDGGKV